MEADLPRSGHIRLDLLALQLQDNWHGGGTTGRETKVISTRSFAEAVTQTISI